MNINWESILKKYAEKLSGGYGYFSGSRQHFSLDKKIYIDELSKVIKRELDRAFPKDRECSVHGSGKKRKFFGAGEGCQCSENKEINEVLAEARKNLGLEEK